MTPDFFKWEKHDYLIIGPCSEVHGEGFQTFHPLISNTLPIAVLIILHTVRHYITDFCTFSDIHPHSCCRRFQEYGLELWTFLQKWFPSCQLWSLSQRCIGHGIGTSVVQHVESLTWWPSPSCPCLSSPLWYWTTWDLPSWKVSSSS